MEENKVFNFGLGLALTLWFNVIGFIISFVSGTYTRRGALVGALIYLIAVIVILVFIGCSKSL